jgi:hypothetical protein
MDYTASVPVKLEKCKPATAINEKNEDMRTALAETDNHYLQQLQPGTAVTITYQSTLQASGGTSISTFLHSRGYYEHVREYTGTPDMLDLISFRKPGRFIEFSKEKYQKINREMGLTAANK